MKKYRKLIKYFIYISTFGCSIALAAYSPYTKPVFHLTKGAHKECRTQYKVLAQQAAKNNREAQQKLAACYMAGVGVEKNDQKAESLYVKIAKKGGAVDQYNLGRFYASSKNGKKAFRWYQKSAKQGFSYAQTNLATMYLVGRGVHKNYKKAFQWFKKAAAQGDTIAKFWLAKMYLNGMGIPENDAKALFYMRKAALNGHPSAQAYFGIMYTQGFAGLSKNNQEAIKWFKKSAAQHNPYGEYNIAINYCRGEGIRKNIKLGYHYLLSSARQGYAMAQYNLAGSYMEPWCSPFNPMKSYAWFTVIKNHPFPGIKKALSVLPKFLTSVQLEKAKALGEHYKKIYGTWYM